MEEISLSINGRTLSGSPGSSLLETAVQNGIDIPTLCHHPDLKPAGACRLCLVEDEKSGRAMAACVTPVAQDMAVQTNSPRILRHRKNIIRLMMAEHPESCLVCNKGNRCRLREFAARFGLGESGLYPMPNYRPVENLNPFIERDLTKCILCGKCIRADQELVMVGAIDYNHRGFDARPATLFEKPLEGSSCTFCGTCVSICPTGALSVTPIGYVGSPERETETTCGFCGVGCSLTMGASGERIVATNPSEIPGTVNGAALCVRGHFAHDYLNSPERLTRPLIQKEGEMIPSSWEESLKCVAKRLLEIRKAHGPQSIAFLGSSKCTVEENYLFQKTARALLGTNNVDHPGSLKDRLALEVLRRRTGWGCRKSDFSLLEEAEAILMLGADPEQSTPVLSYYLKRAAKKKIPLIGVDVRETLLTPFASAWLSVTPGKDLELIYCMTSLLWKKFGHDAGYIERYTDGFEPFSDAISSFNPERLCLAAGTRMERLERVTDILRGRKISFVIGHGIMGQENAGHLMDAVLNLALMTGSLGRKPSAIYMAASENNRFGAWDMGMAPDTLPGGENVRDPAVRKKWEKIWKCSLSPDSGLDTIRMMEEAEKGNLKALYVMGENPVRSLPQQERVSKALEKLDFLVVQDILNTETAGMAHVVLPGAAAAEKKGAFTSMEGRINCFEPVVKPPGESLPDWKILDNLSRALGNSHPFESVNRIREEIARSVPPYRALRGTGGQGRGWIESVGNIRLFNHQEDGSRIPFAPLGDMKSDASDKTYPLTAIIGTERPQLGSGTRTAHSGRISECYSTGEIAVSKDDLETLHLEEGTPVRLTSAHGRISRTVRSEKGLPRGILFVPLGHRGNDAVNLMPLMSPEHGRYQGINICRVRLEREGGKDES